MKRKLTNDFDRQSVIGYINKLDLSKLYLVEVTLKNPKRTISQNSLLWLWYTAIEHETGMDRNDLHELFKKKFILPKKIILMGVEIERYSTADLTTLQFKEYLDKIQAFVSSELGIILPDPEEKYWNDFYNYYIDKL